MSETDDQERAAERGQETAERPAARSDAPERFRERWRAMTAKIRDEIDTMLDRVVALPGDQAAELVAVMIDELNSEPMPASMRLALAEMLVERLNAAVARRDAVTVH